jgi:hypothetical protein
MSPVIRLYHPAREIAIMLDYNHIPAVRFGHMLPHAAPQKIISLTATTSTGDVVALPVALLVELLKERLTLSIENQRYVLIPVN